MKHQNHNLAQEWNHAAERAAEELAHTQELNPSALNQAAGLHVQTGIQGGAWSNDSCTCVQTCQQCPSNLC